MTGIVNTRDAAAHPSDHDAGPVLAFGPFRLHERPLRLCRDGTEVRLGGRALAVLQALVARPGEVLSRSELEAQVWPGSVVEDSSLRVHVAALRRALGDGVDGIRYIANVPARGYSFVAAVARAEAHAPRPGPDVGTPRVDSLPGALVRLIGRDAIVGTLCAELEKRRLVTIVGHGGVGKTSLALAVAAQVRTRYPAGACFVDLAPLTMPHHVIEAVASALDFPQPAQTTPGQLENWLRPRRLLLVLDNCEHLLDGVAALVGRMLKHAPGLVVMATSREALDTEGEWVHRIQPLDVPPEGATVDSAGALAFPAVELLADRAAASLDTFTVNAANARLATALCRRLDGVPLAIEFAASRIGLLGLEGVCAQLDDRLRLLGSGRRTALPRHRTLRALLDWSHDLLAPPQQAVLRRCGVFKGRFSLEAALAVVADHALPQTVVQDCLLDLVAKSLVRADLTEAVPAYSLLEITRAYAIDRLGNDPERQAVHRRHAECMLALVRRGAFAWAEPARQQWFRSYAGQVGNFRAALEWCFGPEGDLALGIELLATDCHPMTLFLGETEYRMRAGQALDAIAAGVAVDPIYEVRLYSIFRHMAPQENRYASSPGTLALAGQEGDPQAQLEALYQLHGQSFKDADYRSSDRYARQSEEVAGRCGLAERLHAGRLRALSSHFRGEHAVAADYAASLLRHDERQASLRLAGWISRRLSLRILTARLLWMQGQGERAMALAADCVRDGLEERFPAALSQVLCLCAVPVALWQGDDAQAAAWLQLLDMHLEAHPQAYFASWVTHLRQVLALRRAPEGRLASLPGSPDAKLLDHLVTFGAWGYHDRAAARWRQGVVGWNGPELLRVEGELRLREGGVQARGAAEAAFVHALALAAKQEAHAWALRATNSLATLRIGQGRGDEARALLEPWLARLDAMGGADAATTRTLLRDTGSS